MIRFDKKMVHTYYEFNGKYLRGMQSIFPSELYPVFGLSITFNTFLTNEYVNKYKDDDVIDYVTNMGNDLITVYKRILGRNTWLTPKTRAYAISKLEHLKLVVGQPETLREDPLLDYDKNDAWGNMLKLQVGE